MEFGSILFHKIPDHFADEEKEILIEKLKEVLNEAGVEFNEYQFAGFPAKAYPIEKCIRCGCLTLDTEVNPEGFTESGEIFDSISRVVHLGKCKDGVYLCNECKEYENT